MRHLLVPLLAALLLVPGVPVLAAPATTTPLATRVVVTYPSALRGPLPAGTALVRADGRRAVVDLGRSVRPTDTPRFRGALAVEPDLRVTAALSPTDPSYPSQWDLSDAARGAADYSVRAPGAWDITTGDASLVVAVLDTGITAHAEFAGRTVAGYDMISSSAVGNDGDARDPNPADPGDWVTSTENTSGTFAGCGTSNSSWHGTHVAGTIGAAANNGIGITGLNWSSKIQPVRVLGKCGGYLSDIADGITWASGGAVTGVPANATPARIISLSLGGATSCPSYLQSAITGARSRGALVVVAAGNSNTDAASFAPANCAGVITVAATGRTGQRAYYSNYGALVDIAAPGGDAKVDSMILSTLNTGTQGPVADSYAAYQGTSMATPHVAGVLSLLLSAHPTLTEAEVLSLMASTATPFPAGSGTSPCSTAGACGAGIINATALLAALAPAKTAQAITFPTQPAHVVGELPYTPGASAYSTLPVSYTTTTPAVCTSDGALVTPIAAGTCTVTASQAGDATYAPATSVSRSHTVYARPTLVINSNAAWTSRTAVSLTISYPSIAGRLEVSNDPTFATKTSYALTRSISWTLAAGDAAAKPVYLRVSGGTMVAPVVVSDVIGLDTTGPVIASATASGKRAKTITYTITTSASDALSGVKSLAISLDGGKTTKATRAYAPSLVYKSSSRSLWVRVIDAAGVASAWRAVTVTLY